MNRIIETSTIDLSDPRIFLAIVIIAVFVLYLVLSYYRNKVVDSPARKSNMVYNNSHSSRGLVSDNVVLDIKLIFNPVCLFLALIQVPIIGIMRLLLADPLIPVFCLSLVFVCLDILILKIYIPNRVELTNAN